MSSIVSSAIALALLPEALLGASATTSAPTTASESPPLSVTSSEGTLWVAGDTYHKVIFNHHLKPSDSERWGDNCPTAYPYLDKRIGSEGVGSTGFGFDVRKGTDWLAIGEGGITTRKYSSAGNGNDHVSGNGGTITNWATTYQHLYVEMICTSNPSNAWTVY